MEEEKIIPPVTQGSVGSMIELHEFSDVFFAIFPDVETAGTMGRQQFRRKIHRCVEQVRGEAPIRSKALGDGVVDPVT